LKRGKDAGASEKKKYLKKRRILNRVWGRGRRTLRGRVRNQGGKSWKIDQRGDRKLKRKVSGKKVPRIREKLGKEKKSWIKKKKAKSSELNYSQRKGVAQRTLSGEKGRRRNRRGVVISGL